MSAHQEYTAAIQQLIADWHAATRAGDVERVLQLIAEDAVFLVAGRPPMKGRQAFDEGLQSLLATHRIESSGEIQELVVSGDLAYVWSVLTVRVVSNTTRQVHERSGHALSIFRKQSDGNWLLTRDANLLPAL
jgi:uncharacterized protein (TIGR02246 family)